MLPDRVSNPGPPTYESGALPIALRGPAIIASTDGSVDDLSQTGSCTSVRTSLRKYTHSEYYMPRVI